LSVVTGAFGCVRPMAASVVARLSQPGGLDSVTFVFVSDLYLLIEKPSGFASISGCLWRTIMTIDAVRKSVDEGNRNFGSAVARRDYASLAALYTENAKVLPPDGPIVSGRSAIEEFWRSAANALGLTEATLKTIDLEVGGDTAHEVGEASLKLGGGQTVAVKYLVVWMRGGDGHWRLHRDIWNNLPAG
jgi:ketosteroid isomerase-like protein